MAYQQLRISASELSMAKRHIMKQTGLDLTDQQLAGVWMRSGLGGILEEIGRVDRYVCIDLVDALCRELLGHNWPLNGYEGEDRAFFHEFTTAAIAAGYSVSGRAVAA